MAQLCTRTEGFCSAVEFLLAVKASSLVLQAVVMTELSHSLLNLWAEAFLQRDSPCETPPTHNHHVPTKTRKSLWHSFPLHTPLPLRACSRHSASAGSASSAAPFFVRAKWHALLFCGAKKNKSIIQWKRTVHVSLHTLCLWF